MENKQIERKTRSHEMRDEAKDWWEGDGTGPYQSPKMINEGKERKERRKKVKKGSIRKQTKST